MSKKNDLLNQSILTPFVLGTPMAADPVSDYGSVSGTTQLTTGDVNNDGYPDIAAAHGYHTAGLYLNRGDQSFAAEDVFSETWWDVAENTGATSIVLGDLDLDGNLDMVIPIYGNHYQEHMVQLYHGNGDGTFELWPVDGYNANRDLEGVNQDGVDDGIIVAKGAANPMFPLIADFNGDGLPDVAVSGNNGSWSVDVLTQSADQQFSVSDSDRAGQNPQFMAQGDFNEDGYLDVVAGALFNGVLVFLNNANGKGTLHQEGEAYLSPFHQYVVAADFNGDGYEDIAARGNRDARVSILYGDGTGHFPSKATFTTSGIDGYLVAADIDNDGDSDLVVASTSTKSVDLLMNNGKGRFDAPVSTVLDAAPWGIAADDFNQDGLMDVAVSRSDNTVQVLWNRGGVAVTPATFNMAENSLAGIAVGTVIASGKAPLTFAITAGNADSDDDGQAAFAIDAATGIITVNDSGDLDFETTPAFGLDVTVTDASGLSDTAIVTVALTNLDEPGNEPPVAQDITLTLAENSGNGAEVGAVIATDIDAGDTLAYAISAGNSDPDGDGKAAFAIDPSTGQITVNDSGDLDFEKTPTFDLTIKATDFGGLSDTATVTIGLTDVSSEPTQWRVADGGNGHIYQAISVSEGITWDDAKLAAESLGGHLATITSTAENDFVFDLIADYPEFWQMTTTRGPWLGGYQPSGSPEPAGNWQWVTGEDFNFTDWAGGEPNNIGGEDTLQYYSPSSANWNDIIKNSLVSGYILEIENIPYTFSVAENSTEGTALGTIEKHGLDNPTFVITAGNTDSDGNGQLAFAINSITGQLTVNDSGDLDFETTPHFTLTVDATEAGGKSLTNTVQIDLSNIDEPGNEPPVAEDASFTLPELSAAGSSVGTVIATDIDAGDTLAYAIGSGNSDPDGDGKAAFAIDTATGVITVNDSNDLDFETTPTFNLTVKATDSEGLSDSAAIKINLTNVFELDGTPGNDILKGTAGNDVLKGLAGDDTLSGGAGDDILIGGAGIDRVSEQGDVNFTLTDSQLTGLSTDTLSGIERATLTGGQGNNVLDASGFNRGPVILNGGAGDDTLIGPSMAGSFHRFGANIFTGGEGNDTLTGGVGIDCIKETGDVDFILTNGQLTGLGTDHFSSMELAHLVGGAGDNRLDTSGFTGRQTTLEGGMGNDTLMGGAAKDWVRARGDANFTLTDTRLTGLGVDTLVKMDRAVLIGGVGNNLLDASEFTGKLVILSGGGGDDTLIGRTDGIDWIRARGDTNFTLTDSRLNGQGTDTLVSIEQAALSGGAGNNILNASAFTGNLAILEGGGGDNALIGRSGGIDRVRARGNVDFTLTDSQLTGLGTDTLIDIDQAKLIGDGDDNTLDASAFTRGSVYLYGESGDDTLKGGKGNDILSGGIGDDILSGGAGIDRVVAGGDTDFTLTAIQLTGLGVDTLDSIEEAYLSGGSSDNILDASGFTGRLVIFEGQAGNDTLIGRDVGMDRVRAQGDVNFTLTDTQLTGLGTDTLVDIDQATLMGNSGDSIFDASGFTRGSVILSGDGGDDTLLGGSGDDSLNGDQGDDNLDGGLGKDRLTGGLGADIFKFASIAESGVTNALRDIVKDFDFSQGDKIDLSAIDADTAIAGDQVFASLTEGGAFSGVFANPGELYFDQSAHILYGNNNADSAADFSIQLVGVNSLSLNAFV